MRKFWLALLPLALLCACGHKEDQLKIAATSTPHAEILREAKKLLKPEGIDLKIIEVDDYTTPNRLLAEKQVDANFFQHEPFLKLQEKKFGYKFRVLTAVHIEPLSIYSKKIGSLNMLKKGDVIAIPNDPTNEARALYLLEQEGLITVRQVEHPTIHDISQNPKGLRFEELDAPLLPRSLADVTAAVIPSNFALAGGLNLQDAIGTEQDNSPYVNVVVVRADDHREELERLRKVLRSNQMKEFIQKKYQGALHPTP